MLFSAKKMDWFKMASGVFDRVENSREFEVDEPTSADISTYEVYKAKRYKIYDRYWDTLSMFLLFCISWDSMRSDMH